MRLNYERVNPTYEGIFKNLGLLEQWESFNKDNMLKL